MLCVDQLYGDMNFPRADRQPCADVKGPMTEEPCVSDPRHTLRSSPS
jgi:hypothetical protein